MTAHPIRTDNASAYIDEEALDIANPAPPAKAARAVEVDDYQGAWNGRSSKVRLARPILRDFVWIGPNEPCVDCLKRNKTDETHSFHIRASKVAGRWEGPEADHYRQLLDGGCLASTPQNEKYKADVAARALLLGIEPSSRCSLCGSQIEQDSFGTWAPACPNGHRNGLLELRERSVDDMRKVWKHDLEGGEVGAKKREIESRHQDTEDLKRALKPVSELAAAIKELLANNTKDK